MFLTKPSMPPQKRLSTVNGTNGPNGRTAARAAARVSRLEIDPSRCWLVEEAGPVGARPSSAVDARLQVAPVSHFSLQARVLDKKILHCKKMCTTVWPQHEVDSSGHTGHQCTQSVQSF